MTQKYEGIDKAKHGKLIGFLENSFASAMVGGKKVIQTLDGEFIDYVIMEEEFFVDNWLMQFAIGSVNDINYFNHNEWSRITDAFTKGVIVINEDQQPVCLVRKFIDMDLNANQEYHLQNAARHGSQAKFVPESMEADQIIQKFAQDVDIITSQNPDYDTLTAMIPIEYYQRHGIEPEAAKNVMYIREHYNCPEDDLDRVKDIMYRVVRNESVSKEDQAFICKITNNEFNFNSGDNKVDTKVQQTAELPADFDPLAD